MVLLPQHSYVYEREVDAYLVIEAVTLTVYGAVFMNGRRSITH